MPLYVEESGGPARQKLMNLGVPRVEKLRKVGF